MKTYYVKAGDTLSKLAPVLLGPGGTWQKLYSYNTHISNPNLIEIGDAIYYPGGYGTTTVPAGAGVGAGVMAAVKNPVVLASAGAVGVVVVALLLTTKKKIRLA